MCAWARRCRHILFFWKNISIWHQNVCYSDVIDRKNDVTTTHILISDRNIFSKKKYVPTSPRSGGHVGERNLFLSAIRWSNRRSQSACVKSTKIWRNLEKLRHCNTYSDLRSKYFFKKKYVSTSFSPCAHFGQRNLFLDHIRWSNRIKWQMPFFRVFER